MSTLRLRSGRVFAELEIYHDINSRSGALNMAIDEALLETAAQPTIRFYRWSRPALSFGYFGKFADVENHGSERDVVRRWTGGGIVLHGEDLTYSIIIPVSASAFSESSMSIYENVHRAICNALNENGVRAEVISIAALYERRTNNAAVIDPGYSCFANPVRADVLLNGRKIAGAGQRRTRRGLLQQGSIQNVDLSSDFAKSFAAQLSITCRERTIDDALLQRAQEIAGQKYATASWLHRR